MEIPTWALEEIAESFDAVMVFILPANPAISFTMDHKLLNLHCSLNEGQGHVADHRGAVIGGRVGEFDPSFREALYGEGHCFAQSCLVDEALGICYFHEGAVA